MERFIRMLPLAAILAISIATIDSEYVSLCEWDMGSHAFRSGEFTGVYSLCIFHDYSQYYPAWAQPKVKEIQKANNPFYSWTLQK